MMQADDPEYRKVFATLDELDLGSLKPVFKEKRIRDKTLSFIKSEGELKEILKEELQLPFGQRFEFSCLWFQKFHGTEEGAAVQGRKTVVIKSDQKPIPVEKGEKPSSEAIVDSYKVDERERRKEIFALEETERVNLTKEAAGACFDNTGAYRKQAFLELPSLGDSKELSASNYGVLQPRKPKEDKQVETLESNPAILKGEKKAEDITIGETSSTEKLSEKDLDYKEACNNERGIGNTPLEEEWISSDQGFGEKSGGVKKKDVKALEKTENSQAAISEGDIKIEKRLSKGQALDQAQDHVSEVISFEGGDKFLTADPTPNLMDRPVLACHRVQKLSSVDASDQEIWTDESETIHGEDPLANEYDGQKGDAEVVPKDIPLHERGVDAAFGEGDNNSNNPLESSSQSKSKKKKKKKKKKKEQNASEETGSQTIDQSVNKDEEEKADDISLHEGQPTCAPQDLQHTSPKESTVSKNKIGPAETGDLEEESIYSGHTTEESKKENNLSFFEATKKKKGLEEDASVRKSPKEVQTSQATFQEGASKPKQQDKRNELSIQTAGKEKETSSCDTTETETTFCRDLPLKKSASSTTEQGKMKQGPPNEKLMNQAHEPGKHHADGGGDQENDSRKIVICNPRPFGATGKEYVYEKGSVFGVEENREIEFKSLVKAHTDSLPWKIMEKAKKFICACLNSDRKGIIYFGVGDSQEQGSRYKHGEIVGLDVTDIKDDINKAFQFVLDDHIKSDEGPLQKGGEQNCITLHFVPVRIQGNSRNLFVIEIEVARDWRLCKDKVYYSKTWVQKRDKDCAGKKALDDYFKVKGDLFDDVAIRTNGASSSVKQLEVDRQVKKPLQVKYKEWRKKEKQGAGGLYEEHSLEEADAKRFSIDVRERLRELNYKDNGYILVANKLPALYRGSPQLSFLQNIPWVAVFDLFDPASKVDGLHYACNETTDAVRATIYTLDDFKEVTPDKDALISTRGTTWILSNEEMQKGNWIKCSKDCLYRALSAYKECFLPGKLVCVFLCLAENAVPEMADIMESSFSIFGNSASSCVTILSETAEVAEAFIEASKPALRRELKDCSITGIPWSLLKEIVREMVGPSKFEEPGAKTELPYFTGQSKAVFNKIINSWNDLEVYSPNPRLSMFAEAIERERDAFYKGAQASQINLMQNHTIARSLEKEVTAKVDKALKSLSKENMDANYYVKTVTVPYEPGSGATTLCRRILWNKREEYRCAVVKAITPSTDFQIDNFQRIAYDEKNSNYSLPVLVLVDNFPENDVRHLTDQIMKRRAKCVVLTTLPILKSETNTQFEITPLRKLNDTETSLVKDILINIMSDSQKRREAEEVLEREKRFIWFGLELFGRDYVKIEERLKKHIHSILMAFLGDSQRMHKSVLEMCCFLNKYSDGCVILPHAVALDSLHDTSADKQSSGINEIHEVFGGLLLEEQNETNGYYGWRPAHPLVSDVVTSGISIEETAIRCLEQACSGKAYVMKFLRRQIFRLYLDRKRLSDPVFVEDQALDDGTVGADLENEVFGFHGKRTRYSPVIVDIMDKEENIEGALRVLLTICEKATQIEDKAYAWQQLARFIGYELRANEMKETNELNKRLHHTMTEIKQIKVTTPRTGIDAAHMAVDIAVSLQPSYTNHYTTKGVLYFHQLRDFKTKTPLLRALPDAVEICRKALGVYHKALETSREPNHFSMIGKIQANVSLLEIVKDLPCFNSDEGKFTMYLERRTVPHELENALSPEDRDYVQRLGTTTLDLLNELFGHVKLKQTTTYDENEGRGLNNAKIRASNLRRKFYEITGFDKKELSSDDNSLLLSLSPKQPPAVYQQNVQDILFMKDETPYSAWSNLTDGEIIKIYFLLRPLCLRGQGSYNDMLICSKAGLQLKEKPSVQELDNIVSEWVRKYPDSEWAHLFYYMIHFPIPNASLAPCNAAARESVKNCGRIVRKKAGSGFRKSGAEYFLGKGIGLNAILSSQEFRWLETKWKTKTDFWRGKEPSERLERVQGRKEVGSKGIISYQGIQLHFDNTLYPNESKDDLWFYVGFTLAGPYAYDPVDKDKYTSLKRQIGSTTPMTTSHPIPERFDNRDRWSLPRHFVAGKKTNKASSDLPQGNIGAIQSERTYTPPVSRTRRHDRDFYSKVRSDDVSEWGPDVSDVPVNSYLPEAKRNTDWSMSAFASRKEEANQQKHSLAARSRTKQERAKWKSVIGTKGNEKREFSPKSVDVDGKLHHGAFVLGLPKSQECTRHNFTEETHFIRGCNFAHGWIGDTLQFVCTKCTDENRKFCKEKVSHKEYIWNLGPYRTSSGEIWRKKKDPVMEQASEIVFEDPSEAKPVLLDDPWGSTNDWGAPLLEWGEEVDDHDDGHGDHDDEGNKENGAEASDLWMTLGPNRFSALSE